jgi:hypothetical protein
VAARGPLALVSFAAAELAVTVARAAHENTVASVAGGTWQTDLLVLDHGANPSATMVGADDGQWKAV